MKKSLMSAIAALLVSVLCSTPVFALSNWSSGVSYNVGTHVIYQPNGLEYQCIQAHTSQSTWTPPATPSLWSRPTPTGVLPWQSQTVYRLGDLVTYHGATWAVIQAHTSQPTWTPPQVPALFTKQEGNSSTTMGLVQTALQASKNGTKLYAAPVINSAGKTVHVDYSVMGLTGVTSTYYEVKVTDVDLQSSLVINNKLAIFSRRPLNALNAPYPKSADVTGLKSLGLSRDTINKIISATVQLHSEPAFQETLTAFLAPSQSSCPAGFICEINGDCTTCAVIGAGIIGVAGDIAFTGCVATIGLGCVVGGFVAAATVFVVGVTCMEICDPPSPPPATSDEESNWNFVTGS